MTRRVSESGFTLLEVLVASMLLAMLITILTMVFSSSSIAWSTGKAGVAEMDNVRHDVSEAGRVADNAVPRVDRNNPSKWGYLVSPWNADGTLRRRAIEEDMPGTNLKMDSIADDFGTSDADKWNRQTGRRLWASMQPRNVHSTGSSKSYIVGVWSVGPDGKENTGDDISTWPDLD